MQAKLLQAPTKHLSLHFAGVRHKPDATTLETEITAKMLEDEVLKKTGYVVQLRKKSHPTFVEEVARVGTSTPVTVKPHTELLREGNGIPLALSYADHALSKKLVDAAQMQPPIQIREGSLPVRQYKDWSVPDNKDSTYRLQPQGAVPRADGLYVMHVGQKGRPQAMFLEINCDGSNYIIKHSSTHYELWQGLFDACLECACDRSTIVYFKIEMSGVKASDPCRYDKLKRLHAC